MKRKLLAVAALAVLFAAAGYVASTYVLSGNTLFMREFRSIDLAMLEKREGVISHLLEDFSTYDEFSESLDQFENVDGLVSNGRIEGTSNDNYGGDRSVRLMATRRKTSVSRKLDKDLSRWQEQGVLSMWVKLCDEMQVDRIDLVLTDTEGKAAQLKGIRNLHLPREENAIKSDDDFPDHYFRGRQSGRKWEDYLLIAGWNFIFWEYTEGLPIDMGRVAAHEVIIHRNTEQPQVIQCDNMRIQDGLLADKNPLNGNWYSPNGLPQYGVFDYEEDGRVRLLNVEWEQYPSNGDHVRILSREATPEDFIARFRFKVVKLSPRLSRGYPRWLKPLLGQKRADNSRFNTYFRLQWDFDNEYDPGHNWSGLYNSLEYEYLGLRRVYPIERYFTQGAEPDRNAREGRTRFCLKNKLEYEINVIVTGRKAVAVVYETYPHFLKKVARITYSFRKKRPEKRYPISVETTGNIQVELKYIEVVSRK